MQHIKSLWRAKHYYHYYCYRGTLESPLDCKEIKQSILKEINPEYSLEGLMLRLKLQYLATWWGELTPWQRLWCWERLKAGGEGDNRRWDGWMALLTWWMWIWASSRSWWWTGKPGMLQSMGSQRVGHYWTTEVNWSRLFSFAKLIFVFGKTFSMKEAVP